MEARETFSAGLPRPALGREILGLAIPAILAISSEPILSLADTAMIGHLGIEPLAARAIASSLFSGIHWIFSFLIFGTTTLVAHHYGANERARCGDTAFHAAALGLAAGSLIALLGLVLAPALFSLMGADERIRTLGIPYFRLRLGALPFFFLIYATVGFLRGIQNTTLPMLLAFCVNGLNLLLDWILIYGKLGLPALGLKGAAWAALISQFAGGMICLKILLFSTYAETYHLRLRALSVPKLLPLFRIGHEIAIRTASLLLSLIFATAMAARMGAVSLSSHEIAIQLWLFVSYTIDGLAVAGQALVAKYLGSGRAEEGYRVGKRTAFWGFSGGLLFASAYLILKEPLIRLFTGSPEVIETVSAIFLLVALFQPLNGIVFVLDGVLIGASDTRFLMWAMLIGAALIFIPISWLSLKLEWNLGGIWTGFTLFMLWRFATNLQRFLSRRWKLDGDNHFHFTEGRL